MEPTQAFKNLLDKITFMGYNLKMKPPRYAFEADFFRKIRKFEDGVTFFEFTFNWDRWEGSHNPHFQLMLTFLNLKVFELGIYNVNHVDA